MHRKFQGLVEEDHFLVRNIGMDRHFVAGSNAPAINDLIGGQVQFGPRSDLGWPATLWAFRSAGPANHRRRIADEQARIFRQVRIVLE